MLGGRARRGAVDVGQGSRPAFVGIDCVVSPVQLRQYARYAASAFWADAASGWTAAPYLISRRVD